MGIARVLIFAMTCIWFSTGHAQGTEEQNARGKRSVRNSDEGSRTRLKAKLKSMKLFLPGMTKKKNVAYQVIDGVAYTQGDIILGPVNKIKKWYSKPRGFRFPNTIKNRLKKKPFKKSKANARMAVVKDPDHLWSSGKIPYIFSSNLKTHCKTEKKNNKKKKKKKKTKCERIYSAIKLLNESTNLHVVPRAGEKHYVRFYHSKESCSSYVGQAWTNEQDINVANWCKTGSIAHEILHAAGFYHTQSRADRDKHITIKWSNIKLLSSHNFWKSDWRSVSVGPYNIKSIMHYGSRSSNHAKNPKKPVITLKNGKTFSSRRPNPDARNKKDRHLIADDVNAINQVYQVDGPAKTSSLYRACLKYKNGKLVVPGRNLNKIEARGKKCSSTNQFTIEDLNGGELKGGDFVHLNSSYNRYLASVSQISHILGSAMMRSARTRFKVTKLAGSQGSTIRSNDRISFMAHNKRHLVATGKKGLIVAKKSSKKASRAFTIIIKGVKKSRITREEPSGKRIAGHWGSWGKWGECPPGYFATGFQQRIQKDTGNLMDDTALNSIRIRCRNPKRWKAKKDVQSREGWWGSWKPWAECPKGHFLKSYSLKLEKKQGWGDDTAANGVRFKCSNGITIRSGKHQKWGKWKTGQSCKKGFIGSFRTRVEEPQGETGDDSTLNGLEIGCRKSKGSSKSVSGTEKPLGKRVAGNAGNWAKRIARCPRGTYAYSFRVRVQKNQGKRDDTALNAIQLKCQSKRGKQRRTLRSLEGKRGNWSRWSTCPKGQFLSSFRLRVESPRGKGDDTGANDVSFKCSNGKTLKANLKGKRGSWKFGQHCRNKGYISGFRTRVESKKKGDNTGLNGLEIACSARPKSTR